MADLTPEQESIRGGQARELLEHPLMREFLGHVRATLERERARASIRDTDYHTRLVIWEQVANSFENAMRQTIQTGELARLQLQKSRVPIFRR